MRIAILNQPLGNRGDEAAHKAFVHALVKKFPQYQFDVLFLNRQQIAIDAIATEGVKYINVKGIRGHYKIIVCSFFVNIFSLSLLHPLLCKFKKLLSSYDLVICAPGGICMGGFLNWEHVWQLELARRMGKQIIYWGRSIGPFTDKDRTHRIFKENSYRLLRYFSYISLRDSVSMQIAKNLSLTIDEVVDSAFLEKPDAVIPDNVSDMIGDDYIVFVPNQLTWHYRYRKVPQAVIDDFNLRIIGCIRRIYPGSRIVMLPQLYKARSDYEYFESLKKKSGGEAIIVIDKNQSSDIQQKIIQKAKFVIGGRYHSVVFAINNNIPFISLSYEHKMIGLLQILGLSGSVVEIQNLFEDDGSRINDAIARIEALMKALPSAASSADARAIVNGAFDKMAMTIESADNHISN